MTTFIMLVSNGYSLEYDWEVEAKSAQEARNLWKKRERGTWKGDMVEHDPTKLRASRKN